MRGVIRTKAGLVLGSSWGDEASQETVAVGTLGLGVASSVMHRVGDDVGSEVARELDQLKETSGCFCTERIGDSILGI